VRDAGVAPVEQACGQFYRIERRRRASYVIYVNVIYVIYVIIGSRAYGARTAHAQLFTS
jgi:hypothetical protein